MPWKDAWRSALYGEAGFFRTGRPAQHFRTGAQLAPFAEAILALLRAEGLHEVVDVGSGGGELLHALHLLDPDLTLLGVELAPRPNGLPEVIGWTDSIPEHVEGLLLANEWLDNVPCDVVEADERGVPRIVLIDPATGEETLGEAYASAWLDQWWPLSQPGQRAEVGDTRDLAWADAVARVDGIAIAIDYGHSRRARPENGSLKSYADGREVDVLPDGSRDVTAHVSIDSLAARVGATVSTQREALAELGVGGARPPLDLASSDPAAYVIALSRAAESGELRARGGWGDFHWVRSDTRRMEH